MLCLAGADGACATRDATLRPAHDILIARGAMAKMVSTRGANGLDARAALPDWPFETTNEDAGINDAMCLQLVPIMLAC